MHTNETRQKARAPAAPSLEASARQRGSATAIQATVVFLGLLAIMIALCAALDCGNRLILALTTVFSVVYGETLLYPLAKCLDDAAPPAATGDRS